LANDLKINIDLIDIGGGFPGVDKRIKFSDIAQKINEGINDFFGKEIEEKSIKFIAEPGRYFAERTHTLVLNVIGKKYMIDDGGDKSFVYYLNDGAYGSFNCIKNDYQSPVILPFNERDGKLYRSQIYGPSCDSIDVIGENVMLPDLAIGESVYIENFGAYTISASSNFNGIEKPINKYIFRD
jgi:ornithine decarboxylase